MKPQNFSSILEKLGRRHGLGHVFSDFLTLLICAFSLGKYEDEYLETINRYEKPEAYDFSEALAALVLEMTGPHGEGMIDVLGEFFQEHLSFGKNGQFFTPQHICDLMTAITNPTRFGTRICDCACGSGRTLMSAAKVNRYALFYGADVDLNCARMTVINMHLNGMFGEVAWMNTLTNEYYGGWEIYPHPKGAPCIRKITKEQSYIHLKLPEARKKKTEEPKQAVLFEF